MDIPKTLEELMVLALKEALGAQASAVEPLHLFIAVCKLSSPEIDNLFAKHNINQKLLRRHVRAVAHKLGKGKATTVNRISQRVEAIIDFAKQQAEAHHCPLDYLLVLQALLKRPDANLNRALEREQLPVAALLQSIEAGLPEALEAVVSVPEGAPAPSIIFDEHPKTPILDSCSKDYTALAREGKLEPVIGRNEEIKQVIRILLRKQKSNPLLIGEAGVGKTSIVEGLALRAAVPTAPEEIRGLRIVELILSAVVADTKYRGEFEKRMQKIIDEASSDPKLIIFIDEIHTITGAGSASGTLDAANILKPALARGAFSCIGATTVAEYQKTLERDEALKRRFQPIKITEPSREQTCEILRGLRNIYETHHKVEITDAAIAAAVELSVKYLPERRLPDKARDLLDQAAAAKRFVSFSQESADKSQREKILPEDIAQVVSELTRIPVERLTADLKTKLARMEETLRRRIIGQDEAIRAVSQVVRTAMAGLSQPQRPYGVFLFLGPTGVGKTELAKALAEFLFDDESALVRFDMSEFMQAHSESRLIGSPPGYVGHEEGGALTNAVRARPYCVILFDEIEKAHRKISDLFLQIFDAGRLTDSQGRVADFRNTIIILTSNVSSPSTPRNAHKGQPGFIKKERSGTNNLLTELKHKFRPELLNRIGHIIEFHPLGPQELRKIAEKIIGRVQEERLNGKAIKLLVTPEGYDIFVQYGYHKEFGARALERYIEHNLVQAIADGLCAGSYRPGDTIKVLPGEHGVVLQVLDNE